MILSENRCPLFGIMRWAGRCRGDSAITPHAVWQGLELPSFFAALGATLRHAAARRNAVPVN
jgi:hypothetical protein